MDRRLKDRLPLALRAGLRRIPQFVLVVSATISITPEAWARVQNKEAQPTFVVEGVKTAEEWKSYTKDELKKTMPANPVVTIEQRLRAEVGELFRKMTAAQSTPLKNLSIAQPDDYAAAMHLAALKDVPTRAEANSDAIRQHVATEMQKASSAHAKSKFTLFDKFNSGMNFDLDVNSLFEKSDEKSNSQSGEVRYGLVLEDIVPDKDAPQRASISDSEGELAYAGRADVKWTIGPLDEAQGRKLFNVKDQEAQERGGFTSYLPKPAFKGKVTPENFENLAQVSKENMPAWRLDLGQEQGYYTLIYRAKHNGEKLTEEHQFMMPVIGNMQIGRRFNDKWDVIQSSACNILIDKRLPLVSVHHMHLEQRYKAELSYNIEGHTVGVAGRGKATGVVDKEENRPEAYSVNYTKTF